MIYNPTRWAKLGRSPGESNDCTPVFMSGQSRGQRSLVGYSPWACKESDMTERLSLDVLREFSLLYIQKLDTLSHFSYCVECSENALFFTKEDIKTRVVIIATQSKRSLQVPELFNVLYTYVLSLSLWFLFFTYLRPFSLYFNICVLGILLMTKNTPAIFSCLVTKLCLILQSHDCSPPGSSVHGISQARILEWVAISCSRLSFWPRNQACFPCIVRQIVYHWATWESCY